MKKTHILLIILIIVGIGIIIGTISDVSTYADFDEATQHPDKEFHIIGTLNTKKEMHIRIEDGELIFSFYMFDKNNKEGEVWFYGEKPQDFEKTEQIVLIGRMKNNIFVASNILLKCPSKYDKEGYNTTEEFSTN